MDSLLALLIASGAVAILLLIAIALCAWIAVEEFGKG